MSFEYNELQKRINLTPLMIATVLNEKSLVDDLLSLGVDINEINSYDETALHLAFQEKHTEILEKLILAGGNLKAVSFTGNVVYENLHDFSTLSDDMQRIALKYAIEPLSDEEHSVIRETKEANAKRVVEGFSPEEMRDNPKETDIAKFFMSMNKSHLLQSVREYIGNRSFKKIKELNQVLSKYPISMAPTSFIERGEENLISSKILKRIDIRLPSHWYLSSSWLKSQQLNFSLSDKEKDFVKLAERFIDKNQSQYEYVKKHPTFENITKIGLANCGELADACLNAQKEDKTLLPELEDVSFLRANIKVKLSPERLEQKGFNPKQNEFQHVFLICEEGSGKTMKEMLKNLETQKSQGLDLWKRRTGYTKNLIVNHMLEMGVSYAQLELIHPITGEKQNMELRYSKEDRKLSINPLLKNRIQALNNSSSL